MTSRISAPPDGRDQSLTDARPFPPLGFDGDYATAWMEDPDALRADALNAPQDLEETLVKLDLDHGHRAHSVVHTQSLLLLVIVPATQRVVATAGSLPTGSLGLDWDVAHDALRSSKMLYARDERPDGRGATWAFVPGAEAGQWDLPDDILQLLHKAPEQHALAVGLTQVNGSPLARACAAFALNGLETRVVSATLQAGNIRGGAHLAGVQYGTAREAMASAMYKVGVRRLPGLISKVSMLAFGIFPNSSEAVLLLADLWGLSPRQSQIAFLLSEGLTRRQAAGRLGLSEATVKKQTQIILQTLGVANSGDIALAISRATALQSLAEASHGRLAWTAQATDPLRFVRRADGSRVAISDFGPANGRPVILTHACFSGRHPPRELTSALIAAGFRPIAVDRPGYGLTDFHPQISVTPPGEPFAAAAQDIAHVLDALGLKVADVIGRGGAQAALAFAALYPERCQRVLLISPIPPTRCDVGWRGLFGAYREIYRLKPDLIPHSIRLMSRLMDRKFVAKMVRKTLANTPPDLAVTERPGFDEDYYRTMQMYALGKLEGYIHEQRYTIAEESDGYNPDNRKIAVIYGEQDAVMNVQAARRYWQQRLPGADFCEVSGKGRLLDYDVPDMIVDRLLRMAVC